MLVSERGNGVFEQPGRKLRATYTGNLNLSRRCLETWCISFKIIKFGGASTDVIEDVVGTHVCSCAIETDCIHRKWNVSHMCTCHWKGQDGPNLFRYMPWLTCTQLHALRCRPAGALQAGADHVTVQRTQLRSETLPVAAETIWFEETIEFNKNTQAKKLQSRGRRSAEILIAAKYIFLTRTARSAEEHLHLDRVGGNASRGARARSNTERRWWDFVRAGTDEMLAAKKRRSSSRSCACGAAGTGNTARGDVKLTEGILQKTEWRSVYQNSYDVRETGIQPHVREEIFAYKRVSTWWQCIKREQPNWLRASCILQSGEIPGGGQGQWPKFVVVIDADLARTAQAKRKSSVRWLYRTVSGGTL